VALLLRSIRLYCDIPRRRRGGSKGESGIAYVNAIYGMRSLLIVFGAALGKVRLQLSMLGCSITLRIEYSECSKRTKYTALTGVREKA
jgi:hypothetical protein